MSLSICPVTFSQFPITAAQVVLRVQPTSTLPLVSNAANEAVPETFKSSETLMSTTFNSFDTVASTNVVSQVTDKSPSTTVGPFAVSQVIDAVVSTVKFSTEASAASTAQTKVDVQSTTKLPVTSTSVICKSAIVAVPPTVKLFVTEALSVTERVSVVTVFDVNVVMSPVEADTEPAVTVQVTLASPLTEALPALNDSAVTDGVLTESAVTFFKSKLSKFSIVFLRPASSKEIL